MRVNKRFVFSFIIIKFWNIKDRKKILSVFRERKLFGVIWSKLE